VKHFRGLLRFLVFTSCGAAVFALYLIVPSLITAQAVFPSSWAGTVIAITCLAIGELIIYSILARTTSRRAAAAPVQERRAWKRRLADFDVEIGNALAGHRIQARAVNASAGGLAVLVAPLDWEYSLQSRPLDLYVPGRATSIEVEPVELVRIEIDGQEQQLVRLRLSGNGHGGHVADGGGVGLPANDLGWPYGGSLGAPTNGHGVAGVGRRPGTGVHRFLALPGLAVLRNVLRRVGTLLPLPVWIVLAVQSAASESVRNTVFQDEATYLYAGRQIVHHMLGGPAPTFLVCSGCSAQLSRSMQLDGTSTAATAESWRRPFSLFRDRSCFLAILRPLTRWASGCLRWRQRLPSVPVPLTCRGWRPAWPFCS
jgi:hypothetical protein